MDTFVTGPVSPGPAPIMPPVLAPLPAPSAGLLRLGQLTKLLRRHMWLIALCGLLGLAGAFTYSRTLPKVFTASSAFIVEGDRFAIPELQGAIRADNAPDPMPWIRTEVQALTSRALVSQVAARLHMEDLPEFNASLEPPGLIQQIKDLIGPILPPGPADAPAPGPNEAVVGAVTKALSVFQDNRSLVISVSFTSRDPRLASTFINALVDDYIQSRSQRRVDANQGANQTMVQRIDQVRADLASIEKEMRDLRSKGDLVGLRNGSVGQLQLEELTTAAARATLERSQLEVTYERAAAAAKQGSSDALATVLNSPTISRLRDQEGSASRRMAELATRYGSDYPGVRSAGAELGSTRRQVAEEAGRIVASLGAQLRVSREQEADVKRQLETARVTGVKTENSRAQMEQLQQEATSRRNLYQTLLERAQQTVVQPAGEKTPDIRLLSPAVPPGFASGPNSKMAGLMGGAGGALLGCLIALARIRSVDGFESGNEVTAATGLPVLATLSRKILRPGRGMLARGGMTPGADTEAMRLLRGRLRFAGRGGRPRAILFVPVLEGDLAANIATAFARGAAADGERVLLVEADLQQPRIGALLGNPGASGERGSGNLLQVLAGADWRDAVARHATKPGAGLDLLLAAGRGADAHEVLNSPHFQNLLVEARDDYELTVLNAPSATTSSAAALAQRADVAVLVIDGRAGQLAVHEAATRLSAASRTPLVTVLVTRA